MGMRVRGEFSEIPPGTKKIELDQNPKRVKKVKKTGDIEPQRNVRSRNQEGDIGQRLDVTG